ncbi:di-trans,poly-cis-decaprenylcistransferase [Candidatus Kaiserbacteria bacterium]|nr:di-trans,poly-cis-decaprenylcistransferase [Candidatus Kaiserbacteria bacterium]
MQMSDQRTPQCVGIILDGNRRWAKAQDKQPFEGHRAGATNIEPIALAARDRGIRHLALYAFSTENWKREDEVPFLMALFEEIVRDVLARINEEQVAVRFVGQRERFSSVLQGLMNEAESRNPAEPRMTLWVCLSYGGRADIVQAAEALRAAGEQITEDSLRSRLWTADMPDADIIIRTSGEQRLSNFLMWQSAYSELFFIEKHWPAFTVEDLDAVLVEYAQRDRRMGK